MSKIKPQHGLEEELLSMIYRLIEKKLSKIFREPVDPVAIPDYYQKIKSPIDLSTMIKKLRQGKYRYAVELRDDLSLMMANCRKFNAHMEVLKTAQKFENSIKTQWGNFEKTIKQKDINIQAPIEITEQVLKNFDIIEDKNTNKKPSILQAVLGQLETSNKKSVAQYKILPPLPPQLINNDKGDDLPSQFAYKPAKYNTMKAQDKRHILQIELNREQIAKSFEQVSIKKLAKYKKILFNKLMWIENKIIKKCLQRKRFKKMQTPQFLSTYIENGDIATNLQLRKLQMYIKMVAYWIEEYPTILSYYMKNNFIDACRSIKRCIFRTLRYRKMPRSTKINLDLNEQEPQRQQNNSEFREELLGEDQSRRYDNQIKSFKRMLSKDQGETIKKYTKIQIKNENGEFTVVDWNLENNDKKKTNRSINISRTQENTEEALRIQKEKRRKQQRELDEYFLSNYRTKTNTQIIANYRDTLWIDWDEIRLRKLPNLLEINLSNIVTT